MSGASFKWTDARMELFHKTLHLPYTEACVIIGCTPGTLAGKRYRMKQGEKPKIDRDDWDYKVRETWEQRKARRKREASR